MALEEELEEEMKSKTICMEMSEEIYNMFDEKAKELGITVGQYILLMLWAFSELLEVKECRKKFMKMIR